MAPKIGLKREKREEKGEKREEKGEKRKKREKKKERERGRISKYKSRKSACRGGALAHLRAADLLKNCAVLRLFSNVLGVCLYFVFLKSLNLINGNFKIVILTKKSDKLAKISQKT